MQARFLDADRYRDRRAVAADAMQHPDDPLLRAYRVVAKGTSREHRQVPALRHRRHPPSWFIRRARQLGFTLDEVRELMRLAAADGAEARAEARSLTAAHLT